MIRKTNVGVKRAVVLHVPESCPECVRGRAHTGSECSGSFLLSESSFPPSAAQPRTAHWFLALFLGLLPGSQCVWRLIISAFSRSLETRGSVHPPSPSEAPAQQLISFQGSLCLPRGSN